MLESHELKFLSIFDSLLEGSRIHKEMDRNLSVGNASKEQQLIESRSFEDEI